MSDYASLIQLTRYTPLSGGIRDRFRPTRADDVTILEQRKQLYEEAKKKHPERWSGKTRNWSHELTVKLNPGNAQPEATMKKVV